MWVSAALMHSFLFYFTIHFVLRGQVVAQLVGALRYKPDSIPDGVFGIFHGRTPSGCNMALGFTQPLTGMSNQEYFLGCKGGWCVGLTILPHSCTD